MSVPESCGLAPRTKNLTVVGSDHSWLQEIYEKRVNQNRDLTILITDDSNERGTGKTTLAVKLADYLDRNGGMTTEKVTHSAAELQDAYVEKPKGSALILDEAETSMSKYRAGSNENKEMRELISEGRIMEKYAIFAAPASAEIDRDLKALFDIWILVTRRGNARVHYCDYNPYKEHPLFKTKEQIHWHDFGVISYEVNDITETHERLTRVYDHLTDDKIDRLEGNDEPDSDKEKEKDEGVDYNELAEKVAGDVEQFVSYHGAHKTHYLDKDLIEMHFDIPTSDAKKVKKLASKQADLDEIKEKEIGT